MDIFFTFLIRLFVVFTALPIHEYAHGYVAYKLGDNTAKYSGRLTLNPLTHFDLIGTTMLLLTGFGFAKPVPVNPMNFKNRKAGMALTALAGPVSNILLATVIMILFKIVIHLNIPMSMEVYTVVMYTFQLVIHINLSLAIFNLLPIPPLDGSKVLGFFLSERANYMMYQYQNFMMIAVFVLIWTGVLSRPIGYLEGVLYTGINFITQFVDILMVNLIR